MLILLLPQQQPVPPLQQLTNQTKYRSMDVLAPQLLKMHRRNDQSAVKEVDESLSHGRIGLGFVEERSVELVFEEEVEIGTNEVGIYLGRFLFQQDGQLQQVIYHFPRQLSVLQTLNDLEID